MSSPLSPVLAEAEILAFAASQPLELPDDATASLPTSFVWMPAGARAISAGTMDGAGYNGNVTCDAQSARVIAESYARSVAAGQRVWIDFNHADGEAAAWVKGFSWDASRGIIASVQWTPKGAEALRDKAFYSFSPAFRLERESGRIIGLVANRAAGGLVNSPAKLAARATKHAATLGLTLNELAEQLLEREIVRRKELCSPLTVTFTGNVAAALRFYGLVNGMSAEEICHDATRVVLRCHMEDTPDVAGFLSMKADAEAGA